MLPSAAPGNFLHHHPPSSRAPRTLSADVWSYDNLRLWTASDSQFAQGCFSVTRAVLMLGNKISWSPKKHFQFSREWSLLSDISHMDKSGFFLKNTSKVSVPRQFRPSLCLSDMDYSCHYVPIAQ